MFSDMDCNTGVQISNTLLRHQGKIQEEHKGLWLPLLGPKEEQPTEPGFQREAGFVYAEIMSQNAGSNVRKRQIALSRTLLYVAKRESEREGGREREFVCVKNEKRFGARSWEVKNSLL